MAPGAISSEGGRMRAFFIVLALCSAILIDGCRKDPPPQLSIICTLDGFGGGDCVLADGTRQYLPPSQMKNFWATTQSDQANFASWCYKAPKAVVKARMEQIKQQISGEVARN